MDSKTLVIMQSTLDSVIKYMEEMTEACEEALRAYTSLDPMEDLPEEVKKIREEQAVTLRAVLAENKKHLRVFRLMRPSGSLVPTVRKSTKSGGKKEEK